MIMSLAHQRFRTGRSSFALRSICMRLGRSNHGFHGFQTRIQEGSIMKRLAVVAVVIAMVALSVRAQESQLGRVEFPTTGSKEAQSHFLRGLAALHSFWYEEAL